MTIWKVLPVLLLTACTGVQGEKYIGYAGSPAWFATASPATISAHFQQTCVSYGFKPGTPEMAQCIQTEAGNRKSSNAIRSAAAVANGNAIVQANRVRRTTCNRIGNQVYCNTF